MIRDFLSWVAPGLATVLGGTALCLGLTSTNIANDVATQSVSAMQIGSFDWAELSFDMRDVVLSGTTTDQNLVDAAVRRLAALPAIRTVETNVTLAPMARPYELVASVDDGRLSLQGAVPDLTTQLALRSRASLSADELELRSGMPERKLWVSGAQYAVDYAPYFDNGEIKVSDLTLDIVGRARDAKAYRDLLIVLRAGPPAGIEMGRVNITPALVSPYVWTAKSDGTRIDISGFVPDQATMESYRLAEIGNLSVSTGLALGSGEPEGFAALSQTLLQQLARLEYGEASIEAEQSRLTGAPPSPEVAQSVEETLLAAGSIVVLEPPRIDEYWVTATLQPGGALVFDGYAPDEATRDALAQHPGADVNWLKLGRGAPERYQSAVDFGLAALARMGEGRFALRDNVIMLSGIAATGEDYRALQASLAEGAPQGLVLARAEIAAPRAETYSWQVTKDAEGVLALSGYIPDPTAEQALADQIGQPFRNDMRYASGEPLNFLASAQTAVTLMQRLAEGTVSYDGRAWLITGTANSTLDKAAIEADFAARKLAAAGWAMAVAEPAPQVPTISPYTFSASKAADGTFLVEGYAPADSFKRYLAAHLGSALDDRLAIGTGAPENFVAEARAAVDALSLFDTGTVEFDGAIWRLSGDVQSADVRDQALAVIDPVRQGADWQVDIVAPEPPPEPAAAPAPEPEPVLAEPYLWSATKATDGSVLVEGMVPAEATKRFVAARLGDGVDDKTSVVEPAPADFLRELLIATRALTLLQEGTVQFDGTVWSVQGVAADGQSRAAIEGLVVETPSPDKWTLAIPPPPAVAEPVEAPSVVEEPAEPQEPEPSAPPPPPVESQASAVEEPPALPEVDPNYSFAASREADGQIIMSGQVPDAASLAALEDMTQGDVAAVSIASGAPDTFAAEAEIGLRALLELEDAQLSLVEGQWSLSGMAASADARDAILASLGDNWQADIGVPPPPDEPEPAPELQSQPPVGPVDISACLQPVTDFSARNAILFQSGAALIAAESEPALDELARDLAACPDATVRIEGHTDSDGDERLNLALSVARAEAVVEALIARGIEPARLYAVGYGESMPIADNESAAGKRLNRRIVVTVADQHY